MQKKIILGIFIFLWILPRIIRILSPNVQIEDQNYIYGAFLITRGFIPFQDFAQPNPPLLESIIAAGYSLWGVNYRIPESLTGAAYLLTALLLFRIASRLFSFLAGLIAATLYSYHFLLFRYHLFERETFATLAVIAALDLLTSNSNRKFLDILAGVIFALGYACKQTAVVSFLPVLLVVCLLMVAPGKSARLLAGFCIAIGVITGIYWLLYGEAYFRQTILFHFIKGEVAPWSVKAIWTTSGFGYLLPLLVASLALFEFRLRNFAWVIGSLIVADLIFFWFLTGAYWPHYLLSTIAPASLLAGDAIARWILKPISRNRFMVVRKACSLLLCLTCVSAIIYFDPLILIGEGVAERYGFDGTPRREAEEAARAVSSNTSETDLVVADPFIGLLSQRIIAIRFEDNWGLVLWMNSMLDQKRYFSELKQLSNATFGEVRKLSHLFWMGELEEALVSRRIAAFQRSYEIPVSPEQLSFLGLKIQHKSEHFEIWVRDATDSTQ